MAADARGHTVPTGEQPPRRQDLLDLSLSVRDVVYVPNATARAQLVADLAAAGRGPSTSNPVYVHRGDAGDGMHLEYSMDGTSFWSVMAADTAWATLPVTLTGWTTNSSFHLRRVGAVVFCKARIQPNSGATPIGETASLLVIPARYRPAERVVVNGVGVIGGATPPYQGSPVLTVGADGAVTFSTSGGLSWGQFDAIPWPVD